MVMIFVLQKKAMVLLFAQVSSDQHHKLVGKMEDLLAGQSLAKKVNKLVITAQSEKMGKRALVELFGEAKADL